MGHEEEDLRRGPWLEEEDETLIAIVGILGERHWDALAKRSGLRRSGKSCRLRWMNYLRPNLKHGEISEEEELIILQLHKQWGNKWARIARRLPGRTDNEIKNYWRSHLRKKALIECSQGAINDQQEDLPLPGYDSSKLVPKASISIGDFMYDNSGSLISSGDSSCAHEQFPNISFANSPFEIKVSDWMPCWSHEHSKGKHEECCCGTYSCLCYPTMWNSDESSVTNGMWDYSSSIWGMD